MTSADLRHGGARKVMEFGAWGALYRTCVLMSRNDESMEYQALLYWRIGAGVAGCGGCLEDTPTHGRCRGALRSERAASKRRPDALRMAAGWVGEG